MEFNHQKKQNFWITILIFIKKEKPKLNSTHQFIKKYKIINIILWPNDQRKKISEILKFF